MHPGHYPACGSTKQGGRRPRQRFDVSDPTDRLDQRQRLLIAVGLGLVAGVATAFFCPWQLSVLVGWDVAALFIVGSQWMFIAVLNAGETKRLATREDDNRAMLDVAIVIAALFSLVGVVVGLATAEKNKGTVFVILGVVSVFTVLLSWFTVHTLFTLRYARLYYKAPEGGVEFSGDEPPDYMDFVYLSFTVGMTFQVSDTDVSKREIRRAIVRHSLLSYLFSTTIIGVTINVIGNLIGGGG